MFELMFYKSCQLVVNKLVVTLLKLQSGING